MENKNLIFFSTEGITSTSANHIANLCKEAYQSLEESLSSLQFYTKTVDAAGAHYLLEEGNTVDDIKQVPSMLARIGKLKALISWLREAIKARTALKEELSRYTLERWALKYGYKLPVEPYESHVLTEDEYYASLSIKERNTYYALQAKCATIGELIHPNGALSNARKGLVRIKKHPHETSGTGRDLTVTNFTATVQQENVDKLFFSLQQEYRELQANLNSIKYTCQRAIEDSQAASSAKYTEDCANYSADMQQFYALFKEWRNAEEIRINSLKIVIPDSLKDIYEEIASLGKK